ncbi:MULTISPECIES: hypothetical protein [Ehrlichia]|uniref:Uncharacterized protein n=1 Tax=Ehrlichia cf. muris str. EmCRT TaxID=1359167 RepID=A0A0F3N5U9_9RICK|nr:MULTISPECIES: hypothetical protein [Ehrlichia]KJV63473.1 hypothetical protein EMUCRT_0928 [Ehrlichia cf. muris str. EmCRT]OUC04578.1 hypothetical protein DB91_01715 [Ehrlichia sp. Wisconsin_h]
MNNKKLKGYALLFIVLFCFIAKYSNSLIGWLSKLKAKCFINFSLKYFHYKSNFPVAKSGKFIISDNVSTFLNNCDRSKVSSHFHVNRNFFKIFDVIRLINSKVLYFSFLANARTTAGAGYNKTTKNKLRNFPANCHVLGKHIINRITISISDVFIGKIRFYFFSYNY